MGDSHRRSLVVAWDSIVSLETRVRRADAGGTRAAWHGRLPARGGASGASSGRDGIRLVDVAEGGRGRRYLIERAMTAGEADALAADYPAEAAELGDCPMSTSRVAHALGAVVRRRHRSPVVAGRRHADALDRSSPRVGNGVGPVRAARRERLV